MNVNEIFGPTIQGEGKTLGKEVIFIRLAGCNLHCIWCDTSYTWDWSKYDWVDELHYMSVAKIIEKVQTLGKTMAIVISGGEPLMQQKELIPLLIELKRLGYWIEIETNGTVIPKDETVGLVDQFNCSPKFSNSGNGTRGIIAVALTKLASLDKSNFKFVVGDEKDIDEIEQLVKTYQMKEVYLMPLGKTAVELESRREMVENLCVRTKFFFTPRKHIELFGNKRGV